MQTRPTTDPREERRQRILELLTQRQVRSQAELQELLGTEGMVVTQTTLSRDLRDLGVSKGKDGYEAPDATRSTASMNGSLWHAVRAFLVDAVPAQNLVVLRTPAGGAQPLALALDRALGSDQATGLVGTIAGDDTVLAICEDQRRARAFARRLTRRED
jgi:transcriptional regulator of arginine metabolism